MFARDGLTITDYRLGGSLKKDNKEAFWESVFKRGHIYLL
jgi:hypothetical protein